MSFADYIQNQIGIMPENCDEILDRITGLLQEAYRFNYQIFLIGNGGSYCTAEHFATDLTLLGFSAHTIPPAVLTAFANDYTFEKSFAQRRNFNTSVLVAFSVSGRSPNILNAVLPYQQSLLFTGKDYRKESHYKIIYSVQSTDFEIVEDIHMMLSHYVKKQLRSWMNQEYHSI